MLWLMMVVAVGGASYDLDQIHRYREEVREMFQHAYNSYLDYAYPYDELRPLSCDGVDTWGSYSLTLIDALDTLAVMGNYSEFRRVYSIIEKRTDFDANINVSVFETNIRIVGGLLAAHLVARRAGVQVGAGWPCSGPLLALAEDAAQRLLPAFDTPTGMPYGTVNLRHGVPEGETPVTCTAGVGTFVVEFGALSRLTGNPVYEQAAMRAMRALWKARSDIGLLGNHIDVVKGRWTALEAGIGAGVDSYYEYLVKGSALLGRPELMKMWNEGRAAVEEYLTKDDWHFWVSMKNGQVTMPLFQNLEAFWPGLLSMVGDNEAALKSLHNYHQVWKQYGFTPEFYNVAQGGVAAQREGFPLRPELIESIMYLYRATEDPWLLEAGLDILRSIQHSTRTPCGYATVKNVRDHSLADRMESFFLAETTKYLYLLFDPNNFLHNKGNTAEVVKVEGQGRCMLDAGGYIFNTEAHPIDPAALACCSGLSEDEVKEQLAGQMIDILNPGKVSKWKGDLVPERLKSLEKKREREAAEKKEKERQAREKLELLRQQAAAAALEVKRQDEEKRRLIRERRENGSLENAARVETNSAADFEEEDEDVPEFSEKQEGDNQEGGSSEESQPNKEMVTMVSRGEVEMVRGEASVVESEEEMVEDKARQGGSPNIQWDNEEPREGGIVTPETPVPIEALEKKNNMLVNAVNNLMEKFLPLETKKFDLQDFSQRLRNSEQWPLEETWYNDYEILSCPAVKFTDRFLIHGEFFVMEPTAK